MINISFLYLQLFLVPAGEKASSQSVKCHGQVYPCDEINKRDWDVKCTMTKTPSETFSHYKCSLGEHSPGCRLTFTRQECDCGNAWYHIKSKSKPFGVQNMLAKQEKPNWWIPQGRELD